MIAVLQGFTVILIIIGAGYLTALLGIVKGEQRRVLNNVAFYIATPALLFGVLMRSDPTVLASPVIVCTSIGAVLVACVYVVISRIWFRRDLGSTTLGATTAGYVNSNNLGLPVAVYILGDAAYVAPLILAQVLIFSPVVITLLEATRGNKGGALRAIWRAASNPITLASLAGLLLAIIDVEPPSFLMEPLDMLGAAAIPLMLMSFGISLHGQRALQAGEARIAVVVSSVCKILVMPVITWVLCLVLHLNAHETFVAVTIAALPTAQNIYNYAATYRQAEIQVRDTVFVTTFASLPVIALVAWLLGP